MAQINARNAFLSVGSEPVLVAEAKLSGHGERVRLILFNRSAGVQQISISVDSEPLVGFGIVLFPGGSMTWEKQAGLPIIQGRVHAIADDDGGELAIYEEVLQ